MAHSNADKHLGSTVQWGSTKLQSELIIILSALSTHSFPLSYLDTTNIEEYWGRINSALLEEKNVG